MSIYSYSRMRSIKCVLRILGNIFILWLLLHTCCFQVLQHAVENQLKLYTKGTPVPVAQITVNSLTRLVVLGLNYITFRGSFSSCNIQSVTKLLVRNTAVVMWGMVRPLSPGNVDLFIWVVTFGAFLFVGRKLLS